MILDLGIRNWLELDVDETIRGVYQTAVTSH
jgi:hypothetical protein